MDKTLNSKKFKFTGIFSIVFAIFISIKKPDLDFLTRTSNFFFSIGLIFFIVVLSTIIRNKGLFKLYAFFLYRKSTLHKKKFDPSLESPVDFETFYNERYSKPRPIKIYLIAAITNFLISAILSILR